MGFVIKLANLLVKNRDSFNGEEGEADVFGSDWAEFISEELEKSNERNARNLGGRRGNTNETEDDETNQFDVNMDNIMKRFKCFNTVMQNNSSTDDDDKDDEDDVVNEPDDEDNDADASASRETFSSAA